MVFNRPAYLGRLSERDKRIADRKHGPFRCLDVLFNQETVQPPNIRLCAGGQYLRMAFGNRLVRIALHGAYPRAEFVKGQVKTRLFVMNEGFFGRLDEILPCLLAPDVLKNGLLHQIVRRALLHRRQGRNPFPVGWIELDRHRARRSQIFFSRRFHGVTK